MDGEAVAEAERRPLAEVRLDHLVEVAQNLVGRQQHRHVGRCRGLLDQGGLQPGSLGQPRACRSAAKSDDDIHAAVAQVERLCPPLVAEADDRDPFALDRGGVDVGLAQQFHRPCA